MTIKLSFAEPKNISIPVSTFYFMKVTHIHIDKELFADNIHSERIFLRGLNWTLNSFSVSNIKIYTNSTKIRL